MLELIIKPNPSHKLMNQIWNCLSVRCQGKVVYHILKFRKYQLSPFHVQGFGLCSIEYVKINWGTNSLMWDVCTTVRRTIHFVTEAPNTNPRRGWPFVSFGDLEMNGYRSREKISQNVGKKEHPQNTASFKRPGINTQNTLDATVGNENGRADTMQCLLAGRSSTISVQRLHGEKKENSSNSHCFTGNNCQK